MNSRSCKSEEGLDAWDLYDMDITTDRDCPKCGNKIISHPDCSESCSSDDCDHLDK